MDHLVKRIAESDVDGVAEFLKHEMGRGDQAWNIHLSLFPVVQRVLNPPYINPHFPKMHAIIRDFLPYLREEEIPPLVSLEINEYARRPKFEEIPRVALSPEPILFSQIEAAFAASEREKAAALLDGWMEQKGKPDLAKRLLLLGSGYADVTLGHSLSCTAFIVLEMIERSDQAPWPILAALADYFCKGRFHKTPEWRSGEDLVSKDALIKNLFKATQGDGIVNLHHTITSYAIQRTRHLLTDTEYAHLIACWVEFMGNKPEACVLRRPPVKNDVGYPGFLRFLADRDTESALSVLDGMISTPEGRKEAGRYIIKGVCDLYDGNYDPHFLTGLASALWVVQHYGDREPLAMNALGQYLNYFSTRGQK